jgi:hypothetical protein
MSFVMTHDPFFRYKDYPIRSLMARTMAAAEVTIQTVV